MFFFHWPLLVKILGCLLWRWLTGWLDNSTKRERLQTNLHILQISRPREWSKTRSRIHCSVTRSFCSIMSKRCSPYREIELQTQICLHLSQHSSFWICDAYVRTPSCTQKFQETWCAFISVKTLSLFVMSAFQELIQFSENMWLWNQEKIQWNKSFLCGCSISG